MSEQCEENPVLARARTAIENGEAVNRVSALVAHIEELEAAIKRGRHTAQSWADNADHPAARGAALAILRALDGGDDE